MRPDLVLPSTFSVSTIAGAWPSVSGRKHGWGGEHTLEGVLRLLAVLALGLGAAAFLVEAVFLGSFGSFGSVVLVFSFFVVAFFLEAAVLDAASF